MYRKLITAAVLVFSVAFCMAQSAQAEVVVTPQTLGDTTTEFVNGTSLATMLSNAGITKPGGGAINTTTDQKQYQNFVVTGGSTTLELQLINGSADYKNLVGVYTASITDPSNRTLHQAFIGNISPLGSIWSIVIPKDTIFGFYVDSDGYNSSKGLYYSDNSLNSDNTLSIKTDHFLMFDSNVGWAVALEDLPRDPSTGKLGDKDYNDVVFTARVIPEPASLGLLALGSLCLMTRKRRSIA